MDTPTPPPNEVGQSKPQPTWFFRRGDGMVFACGEVEAWDILKNRNNWMRRDFEMIGHSNGETYFKEVRKAAAALPEKKAKRDKLAADAARYRQTEDVLRFQELRDDSDEKIIKLKAILEDLDNQIIAADEELSSWNRTVIDSAFAAELALAEKNKVPPRNMDVMSPVASDRDNILANLPKR